MLGAGSLRWLALFLIRPPFWTYQYAQRSTGVVTNDKDYGLWKGDLHFSCELSTPCHFATLGGGGGGGGGLAVWLGALLCFIMPCIARKAFDFRYERIREVNQVQIFSTENKIFSKTRPTVVRLIPRDERLVTPAIANENWGFMIATTDVKLIKAY